MGGGLVTRLPAGLSLASEGGSASCLADTDTVGSKLARAGPTECILTRVAGPHLEAQALSLSGLGQEHRLREVPQHICQLTGSWCRLWAPLAALLQTAAGLARAPGCLMSSAALPALHALHALGKASPLSEGSLLQVAGPRGGQLLGLQQPLLSSACSLLSP